MRVARIYDTHRLRFLRVWVVTLTRAASLGEPIALVEPMVGGMAAYFIDEEKVFGVVRISCSLKVGWNDDALVPEQGINEYSTRLYVPM